MPLIDTNVLSEPTRPSPDERVTRWLQAEPRWIISAISVEEMAYGVHRAKKGQRARLEEWFEHLVKSSEVVAVDAAVARAAARLRALRTTQGRPVTQSDMLIAATALTRGLSLATRNVRDFDGCGIELVNPFEP